MADVSDFPPSLRIQPGQPPHAIAGDRQAPKKDSGEGSDKRKPSNQPENKDDGKTHIDEYA